MIRLSSIRVLTILCLLIGAAAFARADERPNFVYIMADELGYYELSCMGHPDIQTPRIDRMASEGVRFTQGLAGSSLCAPTRGVLMTGKHSGHTSVRSNGGGTPLRAGEATIASVLKGAGYATGGYGKWGCGGRGSTGVPEKHGFDEFVGYYDQVHAHSYYPPYIVRNSEELALEGNKGGSDGKTYSHYVILNAAKKFIRANRDGPFFCYLPITPPHGLFDIPDSDPAWTIYKDKEWPESAKRYAAMVSMVDRNVGEVLDLLAELGLEKKTLVFFCGDNGGNDYFKGPGRPRGFHGPNVNPKTGVAFRGHKGNLYEGGLRIPMIARWPGRIEPGRVSDHLWYFPDVFPTLAEFAGVETPKDLDGISIVPELAGAEAAGRAQENHEYLYWELGRQTAVRVGQWKAVRPRSDADWELYDLGEDVSESKDVASAHPEIVAKARKFAAAAHEPVREGTFHDREMHERDRRAKWGGRRGPRQRGSARGRAEKIPARGLVPHASWKIVRVSSEASGNGRLARTAIDGDPRTHWHSDFSGGEPRKHPHEVVIDLGRSYEVSKFWYLARQDGSWNGAIARCEIFLSDQPNEFGDPVAKPTFERTRKAQPVSVENARGRYVRIVARSEVSGGPWASMAEFGVVGIPSKDE